MTLPELRKFLRICRNFGVKEIKHGDVSVVFGDAPVRRHGDDDDDEGEISTDELTAEQLMFLSVGGPPP